MAMKKMMRFVMTALLVFTSTIAQMRVGAIAVGELRQLASRLNVTCILVFGDSSVDPGNNNHLATTFKGNFAPYGKDFFHGLPTGRFSNGRLPTDFIAEALGYTEAIPGYLDPNVKNEQLAHGVSFASAASGYDDLTANLTINLSQFNSIHKTLYYYIAYQNVLPVSKQIEYLKHYMIRLSKVVGVKRTHDIIRNAIFVISMGTNDFIQNYYLEPTRSKEFSLDKYEDFLVHNILKDIKEMHRIGATRLVVVGVPPLGCMPLVKTLMGETKCVAKYNKASFTFNNKVRNALGRSTPLGMKSAYVDTYGIIQSAMKNPQKYGFTETSKGCCGSGTVEFGDTCRGMETCKDASKYIFWDAVHPTEQMYRIVANEALASVYSKILV